MSPSPRIGVNFDEVQRYLTKLHGPGEGHGRIVFVFRRDDRLFQVPGVTRVAEVSPGWGVPLPDGTAATLDQIAKHDWSVWLSVCRFDVAESDRIIDHAVVFPGVYADLDVKPDAQNKPHTAEELALILAAFPAPTILVDSGSLGRHGYWLFEEPFLIRTEADRVRAIRLARAWIRYVSRIASVTLGREIDFDHVGDLARVLRLPGLPRGESRVRLLVDDGPRSALDSLEPLIPSDLWETRSPIRRLRPQATRPVTTRRTTSMEARATAGTVEKFLVEHRGGTRADLLRGLLNTLDRRIARGDSRHDAARDALVWAMREAGAGLYSADVAMREIKRRFYDAFGTRNST